MYVQEIAKVASYMHHLTTGKIFMFVCSEGEIFFLITVCYSPTLIGCGSLNKVPVND
jgi:hypothetical protein